MHDSTLQVRSIILSCGVKINWRFIFFAANPIKMLLIFSIFYDIELYLSVDGLRSACFLTATEKSISTEQTAQYKDN